MPADPRIRASDEDRDHAASLLREHHAVGRLTPEEFNERLDKVYAARTMGDLDELMADLPGIDLYRLPDASLPRYRGPTAGGGGLLPSPHAQGGVTRAGGRFSAGWRAAWGSWLSISLLTFVIWLISGASSPWFLWVAGPLGAVMLARWLSGGSHPGHGSRRPGRNPEQLGDGSRER
jgi:Domain of unknown function (DUF1707)